MLISHLLDTNYGTSKIKLKKLTNLNSQLWVLMKELKQYWRVIVSWSSNKGSMDAETFSGPHDNRWDLFALQWSQVWLCGWIDMRGIILLVGATLSAGAVMPELWTPQRAELVFHNFLGKNPQLPVEMTRFRFDGTCTRRAGSIAQF